MPADPRDDLPDRPRARGGSRRAGTGTWFPRGHAEDSLYVTVTVAGELAAGASLSDRDLWQDFLAPFEVLGIDAEAAWRYGQAYRYLQANGRMIGGNDLWIAATALARGMPVVTRNAGRFGRVPGLEVVTYRD